MAASNRAPLGLGKKAGVFFVTCLILLILFIAVELLCRLVLPPVKDEPVFKRYLAHGRIARFVELFHWELIPNARAVTLLGITYTINHQGYRGPPVTPRHRSGTYRIVMAGDSNYFGWEVTEEQSLPALLRNGFKQINPGRPVEMVNAGVPGRSIIQGLMDIRSRLLALEPDMLVIGYGWNDAETVEQGLLNDLHFHQLSQFPLQRIKHFLSRSRFLTLMGTRKTSGRRGLDTYLRAASESTTRQADSRWSWKTDEAARSSRESDELLPDNLGKRFGLGPELDGGTPRVSRETFKKCLEVLASISREKRITLVFLPISVPEAYVDIMRSVATKHGATIIETETELWSYCNQISVNRRLPRYPRTEWVFPCRPHFFIDGCHPSPMGYRIIANLAFPTLSSLVKGDQGATNPLPLSAAR